MISVRFDCCRVSSMQALFAAVPPTAACSASSVGLIMSASAYRGVETQPARGIGCPPEPCRFCSFLELVSECSPAHFGAVGGSKTCAVLSCVTLATFGLRFS